MARISTGPFGQVAPEAAPAADTSVVGEAVERAGLSARRAGLILNQNHQDMARATAANAYLDRQLQVKTIAEDLSDALATGELAPDDAKGEYERRVSKLAAPEIAHLTNIDRANMERGFERTRFEGAKAVDTQAEVRRRVQYKAELDKALDTLGKLAGMPGADIEGINAQARTFAPIGVKAGYPQDQVDAAIQNFADSNWFNQATQRAMESANDLKGLRQLKHDLTAADGYYANKLDTQKRNAVLRAVLQDEQQILNRLEHESDRREAKAAHWVNQTLQQIATGTPLTAPMWQEGANLTKGTIYQDQYGDLLKGEDEVQDVLRKPLDQQQAYVEQKEATLQTKGGTLADLANVNRLKEAVEKNVGLLQEAPLLFNANRNGEEVRPLDLSSLNDPNSTEVAKQIQERVVTIKAMQKANPGVVAMKPLLPQEAAVLASTLQQSDARETALVYGTLRRAVGDDDAYQGIMQQIAPDAPVKAYAGMIASKQRDVTLQRNTFSSNVVASSPDVAATILKGMDLMRPTKTAKGEDGQPRIGLYLPPEAQKDLQDKFNGQVGDAFANRPDAAQLAFQATLAYYAGAAQETGRLAENQTDVDTKLVRQAVVATVGTPVDYNGNGQVLAPWGMDEDEFEARVQKAFMAEAKARRLPQVAAGVYNSLGLRNYGDGTYFVTQGRSIVTDPTTGDPLVIDVRQ